MKRKISLVMFLSAFLTLVGCKSNPVYNIDQAPITSTHSEQIISKAIKRAGASLGWRMRDDEPGKIIAVLNLRKHMAKVSIKYNSKNYSINYVDSRELNYDGTNIHSNYNGWIKNLDKNIKAQLDFL